MNEILKKVEKENVKYISLQFSDIMGLVKSVTIPAEELGRALKEGIWFDGSSVEGFMRIHESDMFLKPDPDTFAIIPWFSDESGKIARLICDVHTPKGTPFEGDPRYILKKVLRQATSSALVLNQSSTYSSERTELSHW